MTNGSNGGGTASPNASITKPPQFIAVVVVAAAVGGAVGVVVAKLLGAG